MSRNRTAARATREENSMEGSVAVPEQQQPAPAQAHVTLHPLRHHKHYQGDQPGAQYAGGSSFMERMSEKVASGMGTVPFLIVSMALILAWVFSNGAVHYIDITV